MSLNDVIIPLGVLMAMIFAISLTYTRANPRASNGRALWRYLLTVLTCLWQVEYSLLTGSGPTYALHGITLALATRRLGLRFGLAVTGALILHRLWRADPGAWPAVLSLILVLILSHITARFGASTDLFRLPWVPTLIFGGAHLPTLWAALAQHPLPQALGAYALSVGFGVLGMVAGHLVTQTRLNALARTELLEQAAFTDPLTGLANRRAFRDDLARQVEPAFLLMLDIDHFKGVNDTLGHEAGDRALSAVAQVMRQRVPESGRVYRVGGEEFAVLLLGEDLKKARAAAERIRAAVEAEAAVSASLRLDRLTVSGGLVAVDPDRRATLRGADARLYAAKAQGRNQIQWTDRWIGAERDVRTTHA